MRYGKRLAILTLALSTLGFLVGSYFFNVHAVIPKQVYRSAQLPPLGFAWLLHFTHAKTMINLRGPNAGKSWYQKELDFSLQHHLQHIDVALNAMRLPSQEDLQKLTNALLQAEKPILLHCSGGAERTGLAAAIATILADVPLSEAKKQYSWRYYAFKHQNAGEQVLQAYEHWLAAHQLQHSRTHFIRWVQAEDIYS